MKLQKKAVRLKPYSDLWPVPFPVNSAVCFVTKPLIYMNKENMCCGVIMSSSWIDQRIIPELTSCDLPTIYYEQVV